MSVRPSVRLSICAVYPPWLQRTSSLQRSVAPAGDTVSRPDVVTGDVLSLACVVVIQAAALAVFGGFANRDYGASAFVDDTHTYLAWGYWMAVTGGCLTLVSGILFLLLDCVDELDK